jgi:hypothetical protein
MARQGLLSAEEAERQRRAEEREAQQAALEAEQREQAAAEKAAEDQMFGVQRHTVGEFLAQIAELDRRKDAARQWRLDNGLPVVDDTFGAAEPQQQERRPWRPTPWELKANQAARDAAKETTPATQADLGKVEQAVTHVKALLHAATGHKAV